MAKLLAEGVSTVKISKLLTCDHRTVKAFVQNANLCQNRSGGHKFRKILRQDMSRIRKPLSTSKSIFVQRAGESFQSFLADARNKADARDLCDKSKNLARTALLD